jgi:hypothetical protein
VGSLLSRNTSNSSISFKLCLIAEAKIAPECTYFAHKTPRGPFDEELTVASRENICLQAEVPDNALSGSCDQAEAVEQSSSLKELLVDLSFYGKYSSGSRLIELPQRPILTRHVRVIQLSQLQGR